jgi:hypothetical protein
MGEFDFGFQMMICPSLQGISPLVCFPLYRQRIRILHRAVAFNMLIESDAGAGFGHGLADLKRITAQIVPLDQVERIPSTRSSRSYEASREGNVRHTMVSVLPLSRATWPPSCRAKVSTNRPPSPESARRGSAPCPSSATVIDKGSPVCHTRAARASCMGGFN